MGKILASYLVRVTLRERDDASEVDEQPDPPTNDALAETIEHAIVPDASVPFEVRVTSERLDR